MYFFCTEWLDETIPSETFDDNEYDPDSIETEFSMDSILEGRKILIVIVFSLTGLFPF